MKVMINRNTPDNITTLENGQVFVSGTNLRGRHGKGAARFAKDVLKATEGIFTGLDGVCYGIPTKGFYLEILTLSEIKDYVDRFIEFAKSRPDLHFLVTKIGCGLAGYKPEQIAPLFSDAVTIKNISLPREFWDILNTSQR